MTDVKDHCGLILNGVKYKIRIPAQRNDAHAGSLFHGAAAFWKFCNELHSRPDRRLHGCRSPDASLFEIIRYALNVLD